MSQSGVKILLGVIGLFVAALFSTHQNFQLEPQPEVFVTILALLFLETKAPRHSLFGFASATFPLYVFLALIPGGSTGLAVGCAVLAIGLRSLTVKRDYSSWLWWEFLVDALPVAVALCALKFLKGVGPEWSGVSVASLLAAASANFLLRPVLLSSWLPELPEPKQKSWQEDMMGVTSLLTLVCFLALPFGLLAGGDSKVAFFLPVGLFLLGTAMSPLLDPTKNPARLRTSGVMELEAPAAAPSGRGQNLAAATAIDVRKDDFSFLQQLADTLPDKPTVSGVWNEIVWMARRLLQADSIVVFRDQAGVLEVWPEFKSKYKDELKKAAEEGLDEPVVRRALHNRKLEFLRMTDAEDGRIFVEEEAALALPIHDRGVLYIGRDEGEMFSEDDINRLTVLCQQAHLALLAAEFSEEKEQNLSAGVEAKEKAEFLLAGISSLVGVMKELLNAQSPEELLDKAGPRLGRLVSHDYWVIVADEPGKWPLGHSLAGPPSKPKTDGQALLQLAELTMQRGVAICENKLKESKLPQPSKGSRSVISAPLFAAGEAIGAVLLFSSSSEAFQDRERDLMAVFGYLLGAQFYNVLSAESSGSSAELDECRKQLVQSSKMAAIGQSAAGVAHEINTPLGAVMLAIEGSLKTMRTHPDRAEKRLRRALTSSAQLKEIVQKLLAFSRQGTARGTETDLNQVVRDALGLLGHQISLDNIALHCDLSEVETVMANPNEVQQIVINLLTNARDAILANQGADPREIRITTSSHAKAVELAVEDTGIGMDEATQARMFEPFFTTKGEGRGTGLGLPVTRELVEKHGGAIRVQSKPYEGTRFVLRLPKLVS